MDCGSPSPRTPPPPGTPEPGPPAHCFSYSPLFTRFNTVNPAFFASEIETGLVIEGVLKLESSLRTGFLHAGHWVSGFASNGRRRVNRPPHTLQDPSHNSYSYSGMAMVAR
jgi:hypothetical protein